MMSRGASRSSSAVSALQRLVESEPERVQLALEFWGLNSLEPLMPHLSQLPNLGELSLANNSVTELPTNLMSLEMLAVLDLTGNPLRDFQSVLASLATLPSLAVLRINIDADPAAVRRQICRALPYLQMLNGKPTGTDYIAEADLEFENASHIAKGSGQLNHQPKQTRDSANVLPDGEQQIAFPNERKPQIQNSDSARQNDENDPSLHGISKTSLRRVAEVYGSIEDIFKHNIPGHNEAHAELKFDEHVAKILNTLSDRKARTANANMATAHVHIAQRLLFDICEERLLDYVHKKTNDEQLKNVLQMLFRAKSNVAAETASAHMELAKQADRCERELTQVLQTAEMLEQQVDVETMKNKILSETFDKDRERLNKKLARVSAATSTDQMRSSQQIIVTTGNSGRSALRSVKSISGNTRENAIMVQSTRSEGSNPSGPQVREMTLKQLLDMITAVYESKSTFDEKCDEARQPKETMQQHLITYLRKQYGLQSLLEQHALSIMRATNYYAERNNDVKVFQKIINNEFEEDFRFVQTSLKSSVEKLLRAYLRDTHKRKSVAWIDRLLKKRTSKTGIIYEKEWTDILKYMYNVEDAMNLTCMLKEMVDQQESDAAQNYKPIRGQPRQLLSKNNTNDSSSKYVIRYLEFEQVLLNFQLKGHEQFLRQFCRVFRQFDPHAKGLLDEKQLRLLVLKVNPNKTHEELDRLVATVDPYNNQLITYSQIVNVLQDEIEILASGLHPSFPASQYN